MLSPLLAVAAAAQPTATLIDGETVLAPCLQAASCREPWGALLSETLLEAGLALRHEPVLTSALGGKGYGPVLDLHLASAPLGDRNVLQDLLPAVPALPSLAVGFQVGSYTYDDPYPQLALGLHGLPPVRIGGARVWSIGGTASAAWPLSPVVWLGAEATWTTSEVTVPLLDSSRSLREVEGLEGYVDGAPECPEPCLDRLVQHAPAARAGISLEPLPALFLNLRGGVMVPAQRLSLALDGSRWGLAPILPSAAWAAGIRAGDRWQLAVGGDLAALPAASRTGGPLVARVQLSTGWRLGPPRYWESRPESLD